MDKLIKLIKYAGFIPVLGGGIAEKIFDIDFLKELDLLKGFKGMTPHLLAFLGAVVAGIWARNYYKTRPEPENETSRRRWSTAALVLFVLCLLFAFVPWPETGFLEKFANSRWYMASVLYISFYLCLGASIPDPAAPPAPGIP